MIFPIGALISILLFSHAINKAAAVNIFVMEAI
jgi:hypothetical protein